MSFLSKIIQRKRSKRKGKSRRQARSRSRYSMREKKSFIQQIVGDEPVNFNVTFEPATQNTLYTTAGILGVGLIGNGLLNYLSRK